MTPLAIADMLGDLCCPACGGGLACGPSDDRAVECAGCGRAYPRRHGVVSFVLPERLDATARGEMRGNRIDLDDPDVVHRASRKCQDDPVSMRQMTRTAQILARMMAGYPPRTLLCALGAGCGFDLQLVLARRRFDRVLASDIAWEKSAMVPASLEGFGGALGVFASSFLECPLRRRPGTLGLVFQALHHARDPHATLELLLERTFDELIIVEPLTNWLVEILAALGLARRQEYSGLVPQWLSLGEVRRIAARRGRQVRCVTWWELPPFSPPRALRSLGHLRPALSAAAGAASRVTDLARFGCMAAIHFSGPPRTAARPAPVLAAAA